MKLIVMTDAHANLPALQAALTVIQAEGYDVIVHTGDAIAIGPYPAETLDVLLATPNIRFTKGNHDQWFAEGLPNPIPEWMGPGEVEHQAWTHAQIDGSLRSILTGWPMIIQEEFDGLEIALMHYMLDETDTGFERVLRDPTVAELENLFYPFQVPLVFYGHTHAFLDKQGHTRYINPGSLGCFSDALARYTVVNIKHGSYRIEHRAIEYNDEELWETFEQRKVPERDFLYGAFFGGRFASPKK